VLEGDAAVTILSGAAGSANINAGRIASMMNNRLGGSGPITPLVGITEDDDQWQFQANDLIKETDRRALLSMVNNATVTTIVTQNVPVKVAGTWVVGGQSGYSGDTTGRATYATPKPVDAKVTIHASAIKIGGAAQTYWFYVAKNGAVVAQSKISAALDNNDTFSSTVVWTEPLVATDFLELFVENSDGTDNLTVVDAQLRIG